MTIEQLAKEIAMFRDDYDGCVDPEDMLIDYYSVRVGDVYDLMQKAKEEERNNIFQMIKTGNCKEQKASRILADLAAALSDKE